MTDNVIDLRSLFEDMKAINEECRQIDLDLGIDPSQDGGA